jgi:protocatechuate 3,4-dioxygenase beta subunit
MSDLNHLVASSPVLVPASANMGRRRFLKRLAFGTALFTTPGLFAEELMLTQQSTEGPFYPDKLPLDTDNDLVIINDSITPSVGEITYLSGRILTKAGFPVRNAFVEIWQVDGNGSYLHSRGGDPKTQDRNFQGYGRFMTNSKGEYYFRTIKPISYQLFGFFRSPHIHIAVSKNGRRIFTSQILVKGHPDIVKDGLFTNLRGTRALDTILADFTPIKGSKLGELEAKFDVVLGVTAEELEDGTLKGGIARPARR